MIDVPQDIVQRAAEFPSQRCLLARKRKGIGLPIQFLHMWLEGRHIFPILDHGSDNVGNFVLEIIGECFLIFVARLVILQRGGIAFSSHSIRR